MELRHAIETPLPTRDAPLATGLGTSLVVEGWAFCPGHDVADLCVEFDGVRYPIVERGNARPDVLLSHEATTSTESMRALRSGFWIALPIPQVEIPRVLPLRLLARVVGGRPVPSPQYEIHVRPAPVVLRPEALPAEPRVCICLAAYNPPERMLMRQIASIRAQRYANWICLVQDDGSCVTGTETIGRVIGKDPRFHVQRNEVNLGYYHNFERLLERVPEDCKLVCLADQDDDWYPDKLSTLVAAIADGAALAYSDMRIVDQAGGILSPTFWSERRNNWTDLETLFFANTITGAAAMFRATLLPRILPFPPRYGQVYHDWWIALVALAAGRIRYVDRPLQDYHQHADNVIGWRHSGGAVSVARFVASDAYRRQLAHVARDMYQGECKSLAAAIRMLPMRVPDSPHADAIARLGRINRRPLRTLMGQVIRAAVLNRPSEQRERNVLLAHGVTRLLNLYAARHPRRIAQQFATPEEAAPRSAARQMLPVDTLERKTAPLTLDIRPDQPQRVNMLLATIDFRYFFGGYLAMLQLAARLARVGLKVRLVIHERCDVQIDLWRRRIREYAGLEDIFDRVEVSYHFDRAVPLVVSPHDRFIATSCWSAWLADAAARRLGGRPFVFMIQDYEPCFVPHGSHYALFDAAYRLDHVALFSTDLLRGYFRLNRLGVFREGTEGDKARVITFQNAITPFTVDESRMRRHGKRRCLFYCRPEAHAQRNGFELGIMALRRAIRDGALDPRCWEFVGMGTVGEAFTVPLAGGASLAALPRMSLRDYAAHLPDFDLGMSLMLTPHPSLVPLEMAAAGLVTVTNTWGNKTAERLRAISGNFEVAEPNVEELAAALARGAARTEDFEARVAGSKVRWPTTWDEALGPAVMRPLLAELDAPAQQAQPCVATQG